MNTGHGAVGNRHFEQVRVETWIFNLTSSMKAWGSEAIITLHLVPTGYAFCGECRWTVMTGYSLSLSNIGGLQADFRLL